MKFRVEDNTYRGQVSAYGDQTAGVTWVSDKPCDPTFGVANKLVEHEGDLNFVVARNAADSPQLRATPAYASTPQLRGNHCYYLAYENAKFGTPMDVNYISTAPDLCTAGCYYLAMEFRHLLAGATLGPQARIPGLTLP